LALLATDVHIANRNAPGTNLIEFESLSLDVSGAGLARKSLIVDDGELTGLRWGTPRKDSGLLPETPAETQTREEPAAETDGAIDKLESDMEARAKSLFAGLSDRAKLAIDPNQFESVRLGGELEKKWNSDFGRLETEVKDLRTEIDDIKRLVESKDGNKLER